MIFISDDRVHSGCLALHHIRGTRLDLLGASRRYLPHSGSFGELSRQHPGRGGTACVELQQPTGANAPPAPRNNPQQLHSNPRGDSTSNAHLPAFQGRPTAPNVAKSEGPPRRQICLHSPPRLGLRTSALLTSEHRISWRRVMPCWLGLYRRSVHGRLVTIMLSSQRTSQSGNKSRKSL